MRMQLSVGSIDDTIKMLGNMKSDIRYGQKQVVEEIATLGEQILNNYINSSNYTGETRSSTDSFISNSGYIARVSMVGPDAIYDEFGTGEEGAASPHPEKNNSLFELNDYNSGPVVSTHINENGRHYWHWLGSPSNPWYDNKTGYTEGVPAGCQVYNTIRDIKKEMPDILKNHLNNSLKRYR